MYEPYINDYQATLEKIIKKYLDTHDVSAGLGTVGNIAKWATTSTLGDSTFSEGTGGKFYLNSAKTAWIVMNGNILEFHIPGGKWRVVPE